MKFLKIFLILLIGIFATYYYFAGSAKRPARVDAEIFQMIPGFKPGLARSTVTNILTGNEFKPDDKSPSKKDPLHRQVFVRAASKSTFAWVRYYIFVEYDVNDRLKMARFLKSDHSDGRDTSCLILHEVPSAKAFYPAPCPPDIQDF